MPKINPPFEAWFPVPDDPLSGKVLVRHLQDGDLARIHNRSSDVRTVYVDGKMSRELNQDLEAEMDASLDLAIIDWENFQDADGNDVDCNMANKRLFASTDWFLQFIKDCRDTLRQEFSESEAKKLKN